MLDWLAREGDAVLTWWLVSTLFGAAGLPLIYRVMNSLPGRGYPQARAAGLLICGFLYWIGSILGFLRNSTGSILLTLLVVFAVGITLTWRERRAALGWVRSNWGLILTTELLFAGLLLFWACVRALNPDLRGTEHPMDMAFLSASRRSTVFPPTDPWMSGYAISYYHFGYILMAMVARLTDLTNGVAYNLSVALVFALAGVTAYGVVFDLVAARIQVMVHRWQASATGLVGVALLVFMGNLGTSLLEIPYQTRLTSDAYVGFWDLSHRPTEDATCIPSGSADATTWCYLWWWAYSRMVKDYDMNGNALGDVITETPQFSYVLADLHPHVMALPFVMLALSLATALVLRGRPLLMWEHLLYAVYVGGLLFLNSWDALLLVLLVSAEVLRRLLVNRTGGFTRTDLFGIVRFSALLFGFTLLFYAPFLISFRSQAGGILPNPLWATRPQQLFLMFGTFLSILSVYLYVEVRRAGRTFNIRLSLSAALAGSVVLLVALATFTGIAWLNPALRGAVYKVIDMAGGLATVLPVVLVRRLQGLPTLLILSGFMVAVIGRVFARQGNAEEGEAYPYAPSDGIVLLLIAAGAVLVFMPELVILRDVFLYRINTVFKLWYTAWALWSVASAYAMWSVLSKISNPSSYTPSRGFRILFGSIATLLILLGMTFPYGAITARAFKDGGHLQGTTALTLEGGPSLAVSRGDYDAIVCLAEVAIGDDHVVLEATIPNLAYNNRFGRVSGLTGIPTLLGWDNHETQWRGSTFNDALYTLVEETNTRESRYDAVAAIYNAPLFDTGVMDIIRRYHITYIYVGPTERETFQGGGFDKFAQLTPVCDSGEAQVYEVNSIGMSPSNP
jgi:YYY domain-containing protein